MAHVIAHLASKGRALEVAAEVDIVQINVVKRIYLTARAASVVVTTGKENNSYCRSVMQRATHA